MLRQDRKPWPTISKSVSQAINIFNKIPNIYNSALPESLKNQNQHLQGLWRTDALAKTRDSLSFFLNSRRNGYSGPTHPLHITRSVMPRQSVFSQSETLAYSCSLEQILFHNLILVIFLHTSELNPFVMVGFYARFKIRADWKFLTEYPRTVKLYSFLISGVPQKSQYLPISKIVCLKLLPLVSHFQNQGARSPSPAPLPPRLTPQS